MQALHITSHGPPLSLRVTDVPEPPRAPDQVRIAVEAAGVNPSDVLSLEGRFRHAVLPRILGRDFAGRALHHPPELVGAP
ncbi:MAG TPA: alcohol dehydrogenase catalytic domain-containing protein, partial [Myxococcaceae bacterium]|nr:alcohol dehydrogenase catalytic domain-containing protein [Myxococcaceae bacterium]